MEIILSDNADKRFIPFDRFAMMHANKESVISLLSEFKNLRKKNLKILSSKKLTEKMLNKTGIHPEFGEIKLRQMLATWVTHDLGHIAQISRVMAKQYKKEVGPWVKYMPILNK